MTIRKEEACRWDITCRVSGFVNRWIHAYVWGAASGSTAGQQQEHALRRSTLITPTPQPYLVHERAERGPVAGHAVHLAPVPDDVPLRERLEELAIRW